jgi:Thiamine pyrophosphate enzyme, C-terminal TPP binding domain/FAD binding domain
MADRAIPCGDSGTVTTWAARTELRRGQMFSFSGTMCSMMAALPYAIGAQAAYPDRQVVALTGDGSLTMMVGELATLAQHALPVKVVVMRNDVLGLIKWEQMAFLGNPQYGVELAPVEFAQVTQACGIRGTRIDDPDAEAGLAGQTVNEVAMFDFSKYMHAIVELDASRRFARVQPGVVLDRLRERAEEHQLTFGPRARSRPACGRDRPRIGELSLRITGACRRATGSSRGRGSRKGRAAERQRPGSALLLGRR